MHTKVWRIVSLVLLVFAFQLAVTTNRALAQEFPVTPDPSGCVTAPLSTESVMDIWFTTPDSPTPHRESGGSYDLTIPVGTAADSATVDQLNQTVIEIFNCFASGDYLRLFALFNDDLIRSFGPGPASSRDEAQALLDADPEPVPRDSMPTIVAISDVMVLADGRIGAFVVVTDDDGADTAYMIFERDEDAWKWDEDIHFSPGN